MHANTDDTYAHNGWVQLPPAVTTANSLARHAHHASTGERAPASPGPVDLGREEGPYPLAPAAVRSSRRSATHMTRRGRLVLILLTTFLVAVAFGAGRASATPAPPAGPSTAVVQRGDTLWSIAARIAGNDDIREAVEQITALNGVAAQSIEPGQSLILPNR